MNPTHYIFWFLSFVAVISALMVVFSKKPVNSVLNLIVTFFAIAGHYILLNAQFLAAVHIIVYAGAIMVLFLYVIMMLNQNSDAEPNRKRPVIFISVIASGMLLLVLIAAFKSAELPEVVIATSDSTSIQKLGQVLFEKYLLPFEVSSILFLSAMVGAVYLSKTKLQS